MACPSRAGYRVPPEWLSPLTHPLIALLVDARCPPAGRCMRRTASRLGGEEVLLLLAVLLLLRCVLDPWNVVYYELPFLLALLSLGGALPPAAPAGARARRRPPSCGSRSRARPTWLSPDMQSVFFLAWSLPLLAWLVREAFAPYASRSAARSIEAVSAAPPLSVWRTTQ